MTEQKKPWDELQAKAHVGAWSTTEALRTTADVIAALGDKMTGLERVIAANVRDMGRLDMRYEALKRAREHVSGLTTRADGSQHRNSPMTDKDRIDQELRVAQFLLQGRSDD